MKSRYLAVLALSVLATSCGSKSVTTGSTTSSLLSTTSSTTIASTTTVPKVTSSTITEVTPSVGTATFNRSGTAPNYLVTVNYPVLGGMISTSVEAQVNAEIISAVSAWSNSFVQNSTLQSGSPPGASSPSMTGSYKVVFVDSKIASFQFILVEGGQSLASQVSYAETLNFNLGTGALYSLSDLFLPGSNYLNILSSQSIQLLAAQLSASNVSVAQLQNNSQLGPLPANFSAFNVTANAVEISFSQGQVDQNSIGVLTVSIPNSALSAVVNPNGPVANP